MSSQVAQDLRAGDGRPVGFCVCWDGSMGAVEPARDCGVPSHRERARIRYGTTTQQVVQ